MFHRSVNVLVAKLQFHRCAIRADRPAMVQTQRGLRTFDIFSPVPAVLFCMRVAVHVQGLITKADQNALESSALAGDVVINAAFAVASHSQDLDYLSALFKDIASNRRDSPQVRCPDACVISRAVTLAPITLELLFTRRNLSNVVQRKDCAKEENGWRLKNKKRESRVVVELLLLSIAVEAGIAFRKAERVVAVPKFFGR